jgi:hypothetical protein
MSLAKLRMQNRFYSVLLYIFCTCLVVDCVSKGGAKNKRGHLLFATWGTYLAAFWVELGSHRRYLDQNGCLTRENKMMVKLLDNLVIDTRCSFVRNPAYIQFKVQTLAIPQYIV